MSTTFDPSVSFGLNDLDEGASIFRDFRADVEVVAKNLDDNSDVFNELFAEDYTKASIGQVPKKPLMVLRG